MRSRVVSCTTDSQGLSDELRGRDRKEEELAEQLYEGPCHGGPMDGQVVAVRKPKGFLAIDKAKETVRIYEWVPEDSHFVLRDEDVLPLIREGQERAAAENSYDVLAVTE